MRSIYSHCNTRLEKKKGGERKEGKILTILIYQMGSQSFFQTGIKSLNMKPSEVCMKMEGRVLLVEPPLSDDGWNPINTSRFPSNHMCCMFIYWSNQQKGADVCLWSSTSYGGQKWQQNMSQFVVMTTPAYRQAWSWTLLHWLLWTLQRLKRQSRDLLPPPDLNLVEVNMLEMDLGASKRI